MNCIEIELRKLNIAVLDSAKKVVSLKDEIETLARVVEKFVFSKNLVLKESGVKKVEMTLHLCGDRKIRTLNRDHRGKDKTTDVLSFPVHETLREKDWPLEGYIHIGDIFVSRDVAKRQAKGFNITYQQEVLHLIVHGILHLVGFDHEVSSREEAIMEEHEQALVSKIYKEMGY